MGVVGVLTFVANFNAFDLIYTTQKALAGPNSSTDILGTFFFRAFFGVQLQSGDPVMGATVAGIMFLIILLGVLLYYFGLVRRVQAFETVMRRSANHYLQLISVHALLLCFAAIALFPVLLVIINSFKDRRAIFRSPYVLPTSETWDLIGYQTVLQGANFGLYFRNSLTVTLVSLVLILLVRSMAAHALAEYRFRGNAFLGLFLAMGIMIPIRLGTVSIIKLMVTLGLNDTLWALILVYTASGIPLAEFILPVFLRRVPGELKDAARIDGASEYRIFLLILPLVRPGLGTVAVFIQYDPDLE